MGHKRVIFVSHLDCSVSQRVKWVNRCDLLSTLILYIHTTILYHNRHLHIITIIFMQPLNYSQLNVRKQISSQTINCYINHLTYGRPYNVRCNSQELLKKAEQLTLPERQFWQWMSVIFLWLLNQEQLFQSLSCTYPTKPTFVIVAELDRHKDFLFSS